jgi:hypothetical protein
LITPHYAIIDDIILYIQMPDIIFYFHYATLISHWWLDTDIIDYLIRHYYYTWLALILLTLHWHDYWYYYYIIDITPLIRYWYAIMLILIDARWLAIDYLRHAISPYADDAIDATLRWYWWHFHYYWLLIRHWCHYLFTPLLHYDDYAIIIAITLRHYYAIDDID